jgi:hypothetical protein
MRPQAALRRPPPPSQPRRRRTAARRPTFMSIPRPCRRCDSREPPRCARGLYLSPVVLLAQARTTRLRHCRRHGELHSLVASLTLWALRRLHQSPLKLCRPLAYLHARPTHRSRRSRGCPIHGTAELPHRSTSRRLQPLKSTLGESLIIPGHFPGQSRPTLGRIPAIPAAGRTQGPNCRRCFPSKGLTVKSGTCSRRISFRSRSKVLHLVKSI